MRTASKTSGRCMQHANLAVKACRAANAMPPVKTNNMTCSRSVQQAKRAMQHYDNGSGCLQALNSLAEAVKHRRQSTLSRLLTT